MYFIYFSWWKDFRVPTSTPKVKVATAGKACGVWYEKLNTFQFKLPAGICAADMTFIGTSGVHDFHFTLDSAKASHVAWEHEDYPHTTDAFLLERAFSQFGKRPQVVDLPLPRVAEMTRYHNPTRPAHLKGGALVRRRRSYSPNEFRSVQDMGLEQSPAYFTRKMKSMPSQNLLHIENVLKLEKNLGRSFHPPIAIEYKKSLLVEETLDLLGTEVDLSLHQCLQLLFGLGE